MTDPDRFDERRTTGELGRSIDKLSYSVEKLDATVDRLRDDMVTRREFDAFRTEVRADQADAKESRKWLWRTVCIGIAAPLVVYLMITGFRTIGVGA